jgi:hypothetical protein
VLQVEGEDGPEAPDAGLRGEVEDAVEAVEVEGVGREVDPPNHDPARLEARRVLLLQPDVVVVGEAVDADDLVTRLDESLCEVRADEAGRPRDGVPHPLRLAG